MSENLDRIMVGKRIRAARESLNMSREQFAEKVPMSVSFLQDVEGGTKCLSLDKFYRVAKVLGVSADYILCLQSEADSEDEEKEIIFEHMREELLACDMRFIRSMAEVTRVMTHAERERDSEKE